jgi:tRNA-Thr(GGU) m(6)t(6)A37 methyltransferase TsaA
MEFVVRPIGHVESSLTDRAAAPRQGDEGAPEAWVVFLADVAPAWADLEPGEQVTLLTYLHLADRNVLRTRPRGDAACEPVGVFSTRSPDRPNPIGLHDVRVLECAADRIRVSGLEALDGTPVLDIKPALHPLPTSR